MAKIACPIKKQFGALTGVGQWAGHHPANQRGASSISTQGTCLGCKSSPRFRACKSQLISVSHVYVSLPLCLPPSPLSKHK